MRIRMYVYDSVHIGVCVCTVLANAHSCWYSYIFYRLLLCFIGLLVSFVRLLVIADRSDVPGWTFIV